MVPEQLTFTWGVPALRLALRQLLILETVKGGVVGYLFIQSQVQKVLSFVHACCSLQDALSMFPTMTDEFLSGITGRIHILKIDV